jgi:hypothetical protein
VFGKIFSYCLGTDITILVFRNVSHLTSPFAPPTSFLLTSYWRCVGLKRYSGVCCGSKSYTKFSSRHVLLNLNKTCQDRCVVVVVCSVEFFISYCVFCIFYYWTWCRQCLCLLSCIIEGGRAGQVGQVVSTFMLFFSYIYSCSLLNIVILKPSRLFVHLHWPDCFYHFEQSQEECGAVRVVAHGLVVLLFVWVADLALLCVYGSKLSSGDYCYSEKFILFCSDREG